MQLDDTFRAGETIPSNALIATNFVEANRHHNQFPVEPICHFRSWGLFKSTGEYIAPYEGAYWNIVP